MSAAGFVLDAPDVLRALALMACVWAVLSIGDGRR
jgi:hypothetical protein